jgi:hypothetical protein
MIFWVIVDLCEKAGGDSNAAQKKMERGKEV